MPRPNLLFLFGDEHRRQALGAYDNPDVQTPALDGLAKRGVRFTSACTNMPVCTPSRGSILSGCWPQRHGALANDLRIDPAAPSIARALTAAGYDCGYVGKWHLGGIPRWRFIPPGPERLGFDAFWASWNCHHDYFKPKFYRDTPDPIVAGGRYEPEVQTDLAIEWLKQRRLAEVDDPFCLFLSYGTPHSPYRPLPPDPPFVYDPKKITVPPGCDDSQQTREDLAAYYQHVSALDSQVARLLTYLFDTDAIEETLVVYTSDHGSMLGSHGVSFNQWPYEESIGIPLLVAGPGVPAGGDSDLLIGVVDYAPTILGLLGAQPPPLMQGLDLSSLVSQSGSNTSRPEALYLQEVAAADQATDQGIQPWRGLRTARYTYARDLRGPWLLFDNENDPHQYHNLVADPAAAARLAGLEVVLADWMSRTNDSLEPVESAMARHNLLEAWREREAHLSESGNMLGGLQ